MKVLVLGGAGYIGSHTVYALIEQGFEVVIVDNLQTGHMEALHPQAKFYLGDIRDKSFLDSVFKNEKIDAVVHFAAASLVGESMVDPLKYYDNNVSGTRTVLESMADNKVNKIVFSSTAAVYGEPKTTPILEDFETNPTNVYGETKYTIEKMMRWANKCYGLEFVALRYFNACGARKDGIIGEDHQPESHLIPLVLQVPNKKREFISIFGDDFPTKDGTCIRDYIHVLDLADAHVLALKYLVEGNPSDVFNLGNGIGFSVKEVIEVARRVTGDPIKEVVAGRRSGDPATLIASSEKAIKVLGWQPKHTEIEEIIEDAWNFHQQHPNGFGK